MRHFPVVLEPALAPMAVQAHAPPRGIPLLPVLLALLLGVLMADWLPMIQWPSLPLLLLAGLFGLCLWRRKDRAARWSLWALFFVLGLVAHPPPSPADVESFSALDAETPLILEGRVLEVQRLSGGRNQLTLDVHKRVEQDRVLDAEGQVRLVLDGSPPSPGLTIRCKARLSRFETAGNPNQPDPRQTLSRDLTVRRGFIAQDQWVVMYPLEPPPLQAHEAAQTLVARFDAQLIQALQARETMRSALRSWYRAFGETHQVPEVAGLMLGLALGERSDLSEATRAEFSRSGLAHLLAISGSHFSLVASGVERLLLTLLLLLPWSGRRMNAPALSHFLALLPTAGYALLIGLSPSIGRAVCMTLMALTLRCGGRRVRGRVLLIFAGVVLTVLEPTALWDIGTQLSFASVLALMTLAPRLTHWGNGHLEAWLARSSLSRTQQKRLEWPFQQLWLLLATSIAATLATAPFCAYHFQNIPLVGLLANVVAVPLLGALSLPPLLVGSMLFLLGLPGANTLLELTRWVLEPGLAVASLFGNPDYFPSLEWQPDLWQAVLMGILLWGGVQLGQVRRIALSSSLALLMLSLTPACHRVPGPAQLSVTQLNVGQGDGTVLEFPNGQVMVIDAGGLPPGSRSSFEPGKKVVLPFLKARGHSRIDVMVLTHPHPDHMGGLVALARAMPVGELWLGELPNRDGSFRELVEILETRGTTIRLVSREQAIPPMGGVQMRCIHPSQDWKSRLERKKDRTTNNGSVVLELTFGEIDLLFTGDIEEAVEQQLVEDGVLRPVEVVKVPHHGSDTSSTPAFVEALAPRVAVMGVGRDNRFGFPRREVVRRWALAGAHILRTDRDGAVELQIDGKSIHSRLWHPDRPERREWQAL